jgi:uncharacterized protein
MAFRLDTYKRLLLLLLFWAYPAALPAVTPPLPAQPSQYVVDLAGVLDAGTQARLNARLKDLEVKTTAQVVILTVNSLEGEPIDSFSHQTAVKWRIGQKGKDNGVLLTVAVKDHKYRLEVGYGLEATLPDSLVGSIGRQYLVPNFRKGDFAAGIVAAASEVISKIAAAQGVEIGGPEPRRLTVEKKTGRSAWTWIISQFTSFLVIVFIILLLNILSRRKRGRSGGGFWFFGGSGGGGSWGGGDSGGFGGGGGDFGGGGASGDW